MKLPPFIQKKVPLAPFTSFKVGGAADYFAQVGNFSELKEAFIFAREHYLQTFVLGKGTNILVSDSGFKGLVIKLSKEFGKILVEDKKVIAGGAAQIAASCSLAVRNSLSGLEWASGIPGTVGGAVKMNAGAHGFSISDILSSAVIFDSSTLELKRLKKNEIEFGYRASSLKDFEIVLEAEFKLMEGNPDEIKKRMESFFQERKKKQPIGQRSAGSVFKNPSGDFAGRLIEAAGLKGVQIGGARVSEVHANFIINSGNATAKEIYNLIRKIQQEVYNKFQVMLELEIILVGEFES